MDDNESYTDIEFGCVVCGELDCDCRPQPNPFDKYRIRRSDAKNIVIEKFGDKLWRVISYHGNSTSSLVSGLFNVIIAEPYLRRRQTL